MSRTTNPGFDYDAFISASPADRAWVSATLLPRLEGAGLRICLAERDFELGAPKLINVERAVERSRKTVLVITPSWLDGEWATFEALLVQASDPAGRRQRLIPAIVEPAPLPARLDMLTSLDLTDPSRFDAQVERLVAALRAGGMPPARSQPAAPRVVSRPATLGDGRLDYERGLRALEQHVQPDGGPDWADFSLHKEQLMSNLRDERRYGSTETTRAARSRIVDQLNPLALRLTQLSFTDLCLGRTRAE